MRQDLDRPCVVMVAPNGARRQKKDHPNLPINPEELAGDAEACFEAGAAAIHLHARDGNGRHTLSPHIYDCFIQAVRNRLGERMWIQATTEAVGRYTPEQQIAAMRGLNVRPDGISLAIRELIPDEEHLGPTAEFLTWLGRERITPQFILYKPEDVNRFADLRARGVIKEEKPQVILVLGRYLEKGQVVEPRALLSYLQAAGANDNWTVCAFGREETACLTLAACLGGHIRVGFENSLWHGDGRTAASNAAKVAEIVNILGKIGRAAVQPGDL